MESRLVNEFTSKGVQFKYNTLFFYSVRLGLLLNTVGRGKSYFPAVMFSGISILIKIPHSHLKLKLLP